MTGFGGARQLRGPKVPRRWGGLPSIEPGELFVRGPIPLEWIARAACLPGRSLQVGLLLWFRTGIEQRTPVALTPKWCKRFGVSRYALSRALDALTSAGLVEAVRGRGRAPRVQVKMPQKEIAP